MRQRLELDVENKPLSPFRGKAYLSDLKLKSGIRRMLPERPGMASLEQRRAQEIKSVVERYWRRMNPTREMPWTAREERALADLIAMTRLCGLDFAKLLANREQWPGIDHARRPSKWLRDLPQFIRAPRKEAVASDESISLRNSENVRE